MRARQQLARAHEFRLIQTEDALDGRSAPGGAPRRSSVLAEAGRSPAPLEKLRIDLRHRLGRDPSCSENRSSSGPSKRWLQITSKSSTTSSSVTVTRTFFVDDLDRAVDDVVERIGAAPAHGVRRRAGAVPERGGRDQPRRAETGQRRGDLLGHAERDPVPERRAEATERQHRHPPAELVVRECRPLRRMPAGSGPASRN